MDPLTTKGNAFVRVGGASDTGNRKEHNEDYFLLNSRVGLYVVADGVGGRNAGEVASALAAHSMMNFFESTAVGDWTESARADDYRKEDDRLLEPPAQRLCAAIRKANSDVIDIASAREEHRTMNTTVVAAHIEPGRYRMHVAHVGDSRCYRWRGQKLEQLTVDHSLRNEARVSNPRISEAELRAIPGNVITRAIGNQPKLQIDAQSIMARPGDVYVLCSDGIPRELDDASIIETLRVSIDPDEAAENLVGLANAHRGRDNITAVVVQFAS